MPYEKRKREKIDLCNICNLVKPLSWDHVPPKGGIAMTSVEIRNIFKTLTGKADDYRISQNGVKYRTICSKCNADIGSFYDPVLNDFNRSLGQFLKTNIILPRIVQIETKPKRLFKAILSHILTAKLNIDEVKFDKTIREFVTSEIDPIPKDINIFYWVYPYDTTIILRDFSIVAHPGDFSTFSFCQLLKYFPIAFLVTDSYKFRGLPNLSDYANCEIDTISNIPIDLRNVHSYDWPERVDESNILVMTSETQNGIQAKPR